MANQRKLRPTTIIWGMVSALLVITLLIAPGLSATSAAAAQRSYIVQGTSTDEVVALIARHGGELTSRLDIINGAGALLTEQAAQALDAEPGVSLSENRGMNVDAMLSAKGSSDVPVSDYGDAIGAEAVWAAGITGKGVGVALLDSGVAKMNQLVKPTSGKGNRIVGWNDFVDGGGKGKIVDPNGHGTHVAGVIANSEIGADNEYNGVAPDVNLVVARVADENGYATYETVIQGIAWVLETKSQYNTRVLNISMSAQAVTPYWMDPVNQALMVLWKSGIVVVAAAGNKGPNALTIGVPGNNPYIVTVGAFTDSFTPDDWSDDYIPTFSSAGPTQDGFIKPDLVAPGAHIVSLMGKESYLKKMYPEAAVGKDYFKLAGTSQATAVVSGLAALVIAKNPALTPDQVKYRLMASAAPQFNTETGEAGYAVWQQGSGRVFAPLAVLAPELTGRANGGMDINADLAHVKHYLGYSYRGEDGTYHLFGDDGSWAGGAGVWDGITHVTKGGFWADKGGFWADLGGFWADKGGFWADKGGFWADKGGFWADKGGFWADWNAFMLDKGGFWADKGGFWADKGGFWADMSGFWGQAGSYSADALESTGDLFGDPDFSQVGGFWADKGGFWADSGFWSDSLLHNDD
ncbi:MAG: S8 family peptidase [Chloroflexota bacterium]